MKSFFYFFPILLVSILFFSCNKNIGNAPSKDNVILTEEKSVQEIYPKEEKSHYGTTCFTNVFENNVNVRDNPSLEAEVVFQLHKDNIIEIRGFSNETSTIDNYFGNWINISLKIADREYMTGWVFSKYINLGEIKPSPINFAEFVKDKKDRITRIKVSYSFNNNEIFNDIYYTSYEHGNYYIIRGPYEHGFHYSNIPGIYSLNKDTLELKHITYSGAFEGDGGHDSLKFTDDLKYIALDSGTSSGIRGVTVWRLSDNKKIFSGIYYNYFRLTDNTIDFVYIYDGRMKDEEIITYGKNFTENNPLPPDIEKGREQGLFVEVILNCRYNFETGEREILGGEYILTQ